MTKLFQGAALAALCTFAITAPASASSDGTIGSDSTGTVQINAAVPGRVQITGLADVDFGTVDPTANASDAQSVCVWSNTSGRKYNVTATGDGGVGGTDFSLSDGTDVLPYTVEWASASAATSGSLLTSGSALAGLSSAAVNPSCSAGANKSASLIVKMASTDLVAAVAGSYSGTLTLVVAPE